MRQGSSGICCGVGAAGDHRHRALGPDPVDRGGTTAAGLIEAGWEPGDAVVLAAAGSSDALGPWSVHLAARQPESLIGGRVEVGFIATAEPTVPQAISRARRWLRRGGKLVVASSLLAPACSTPAFLDGRGAVAEPSVPTPHLRPSSPACAPPSAPTAAPPPSPGAEADTPRFVALSDTNCGVSGRSRRLLRSGILDVGHGPRCRLWQPAAVACVGCGRR